MSLKIDVETSNKDNVAAVLEATANWIRNTSNKRVVVLVEVKFL